MLHIIHTVTTKCPMESMANVVAVYVDPHKPNDLGTGQEKSRDFPACSVGTSRERCPHRVTQCREHSPTSTLVLSYRLVVCSKKAKTSFLTASLILSWGFLTTPRTTTQQCLSLTVH